ncbi:MAG: hypothetical protein RL215_3460, partial [Planctomycetota bacterium]
RGNQQASLSQWPQLHTGAPEVFMEID